MNKLNLENKSWTGGNGKGYSFLDIISIIKNCPTYDIHVGTDSHIKEGKWQFAVAVCLHGKNMGSRYFYHRFKIKKDKLQTLGTRLQKEVESSISIANMILDIGVSRSPIIHADTSSDPAQKSFQHTMMLTNWIQAMGYKCLVKPNAWASGSIADRHAK